MTETFKSLTKAPIKLGRMAEVNEALVSAFERAASVTKKNGTELKTRRVVDGEMAQGEAASL